MAARFDVDSNFLLRCPEYNIVQNVISSSVGSDQLPQISLKSVQYSCKVKEMPMLARDMQQDNGTGHSDNTDSNLHRAQLAELWRHKKLQFIGLQVNSDDTQK